MRKALVVGIDHYEHIGNLGGCVNDAHSVKAMLERHADASVNFGTKIVVGTGPADILTRVELKEAVRELFADDSEVALFYFAGHGYIEATGGYLCAGDCKTGDDGLPLAEIMSMANDSPARNKIIILDSCHSGALGDSHTNKQISEIAEGMTILTASTKGQYAAEKNGGGLFTGLLVDALGGAAANLVGEVTPGSVYAHVDQSLGSWSRQRPVYKTPVMFSQCGQLHGLALDRCMIRVRGSDRHRQINPIVPLQYSKNGRLDRVRARVFRLIRRVQLIFVAGIWKELSNAT